MPVHNGEMFLRPAMESILNQTFTDFEFIVVDDGSTDRTCEIVRSYEDPRIRLARNESKLGLARTLNKGVELAAGQYIARMDSDDISLPERLARQVVFMDAHREVDACGTFATDIDPAGNIIGDRPRILGKQLEYFYWIPVPIIHPTAMMRAGVLKNLRYKTDVLVEDFDLWLRLVKAGHKLSNLPEYLFLYRVHDASFTSNTRHLFDGDYEVFRNHIGTNAVSYDEFYALFQGSCGLNPLRRGLTLWRIAKSIHKPYYFFLMDNIRYTKRWLPYRAYQELISRTTLRPLRLALRWVKSIVSDRPIPTVEVNTLEEHNEHR